MILLHSQPFFTKKSDQSYVMELQNKFYNIDFEVKSVFDILYHSSNFKDAAEKYNALHSEQFTADEFQYYAEEIYKSLNIDEKPKSFLLIEKIILSPQVAGEIADAWKWMFKPTFFWFSFLFLVLFSLFILFFLEDHHHENTFQISILPFLIVYGFTILFHEIGHIASCRKFTGKNGGVGVGIYLIYPVLYSDISAIWHADKKSKIITNLAGIYMQLWFVPILFLVAKVADIHFFEDFVKALVFICFIQLIPFVRSDGYWLLCDIFETPNLLTKSQEKLRNFFSKPLSFIKQEKFKSWMLLSYALVNIGFVVLFAYYQIRFNWNALVGFPQFLWTVLVNFFTGKWEKINLGMEYFTAILFYYIVYSYLKMFFQRIFGKNKK